MLFNVGEAQKVMITAVWPCQSVTMPCKCAAFATVEQSPHVPYSVGMASKSLLQQNPHLRNAQDYERALRANVLSSMAIEGVKKAAERALPPARVKRPAKAG